MGHHSFSAAPASSVVLLVQPDFVAEEVVEEVGDVGEGDVHPD